MSIYEIKSAFGTSMVEAKSAEDALDIAISKMSHRAMPKVVGLASPARIAEYRRKAGEIETRSDTLMAA